MIPPVHLVRAAADPICPRVSAGGTPGVGYYVVYRGDLDGCVAALEAALDALKKVQALPPPLRPKIDPSYTGIGGSFQASNS